MSKQQQHARPVGSQRANRVSSRINDDDSACSDDAETQVIEDGAQLGMGALVIGDAREPMLLSPGQTARELARKMATEKGRSSGGSGHILLLPGQTLRDLTRMAAAQQPSICVNCRAHPAYGALSVSDHPDWCEHCDTSAWAASVCSYCSVRPVVADSLCGMHMCDACDIAMWVVRTGKFD